MIEHRAIAALIWGMPAVNGDLMYQAMLRETKGRDNQMLYWSRLLDWKNQTLTPNTDVIYLTRYFDTKDVGPTHRRHLMSMPLVFYTMRPFPTTFVSTNR